MPRSRSIRVLRGASAATVATFVALVSHVSGGGAVPGILGIAVPWVLSVMVCTLLAGRMLSLVRVAVGVGISQMLFHVLFVLGSVSSASSSEASSVATATGHAHDHGAMLLTGSAMSGGAASLGTDASMWIAHAIAAAITVAALYRGERALARLLDLAKQARTWLRRLVTILDIPGAEHPSPAPSTAHATDARLPLDHSASSLSRRGPPALSVI